MLIQNSLNLVKGFFYRLHLLSNAMSPILHGVIKGGASRKLAPPLHNLSIIKYGLSIPFRALFGITEN